MSLTPGETSASGGLESLSSPKAGKESLRLETGILPGIKLHQVIVVQGGSGTGKTTIGKELARELGWVHFSSGLLYRAAGFLVKEAAIPKENGDAVTAAVMRAFSPEGFRKGSETFHFTMRVVEESGLKRIRIFYSRNSDSNPLSEPKDITQFLHDDGTVTNLSYQVAPIPSLRAFFRDVQRRRLPGSDLVVDGRDSHKVFGKTIVGKFWIETDPKVAATRVLARDGIFPGSSQFNVRFAMAEASLSHRDQTDRARTVDPAVRPRGFKTIRNDAASLQPAIAEIRAALADRIKI